MANAKQNEFIGKTLLQIVPQDIFPNPSNPRLIFDPEELNELKKSIAKVGILVPLTIFKNNKKIPKTMDDSIMIAVLI